MLIKEVGVIKQGEDLIKFVGEIISVSLDGKKKKLPQYIRSFKVCGSSNTHLIGYDEEMLRIKIPVKNIVQYSRYEK